MGPRILSEHPKDLVPEGSGYLVKRGSVYLKNFEKCVRACDLKSLSCGICSKILRDPIQLISCGCRFCNACIQRTTTPTSSSTLSCPCDGETYTLRQIRKDKGCMKDIEQLEAKCQATSPCSWRGPLSMLEQHQTEECPNSLITCQARCGQKLLRSEETEHALKCSKREASCQFCFAAVPYDELEDHYSRCPSCPVTCDSCASAIPQRREYARHLDEVCNGYELHCPMERALQCTFKGKRAEMTQHVINNHLLNVVENVTRLTSKVDALESLSVELMKKVEEKDATIDQLESKLVHMEKLALEPKEVISKLNSSECFDSHPLSPTNYSKFDASFRGENASLSDPDYNRLPSSSLTHVLRETVEKHGNQITLLHEGMLGLQQNITQYSLTLDKMHMRQDILDVRTTNGIFIWKIPDIRRRYRDALEGRTISLYSPPFQTSPHGYRMCIRAYLNGDGSGKGTYISLFFVLMRSEHDDLLPFPFRQSVRFTLINQARRAESITEAFSPDLDSKSFQKPQSDMNIASGFPKFARLAVLHDENITQGNAIYIKTQVDLLGLAQE